MESDQKNLFEDEETVIDLDETEEIIEYTYSITAYGADYPVDSLVKRLENKDILVPRFSWQDEDSDVVGFQREYVWPRTKADKFIESLLLGLPVPGIFLVKEPDDRLLVLDGHQRLHTLKTFYEGVLDGKEFRLNKVQPQFEGKRYKDLSPDERRRLDNSIIHATIIKQDEPEEDQSSIYMIFERLNTGGMNLQPQEIRVALYHGEFVRVLKDLNEYESWRSLFGNKSKRLKDMELILRFFAFYYHLRNYESTLKDFLNRYMASNRNLQNQSEEDLSDIFKKTTDFILATFGEKAFRPKRAVNAAVLDSLMNGIAHRINEGNINDLDSARESFSRLMKDPEYLEATETGTSQKSNVMKRMESAINAFKDLK